jgi:hypothetical protein
LDNYDYFGDQHSSLELSKGRPLKKQLTDDNYHIRDVPVQYVPRDRLLSRQALLQNQKIEGQNRSIVLNDGKQDRAIFGYAKNAF